MKRRIRLVSIALVFAVLGTGCTTVIKNPKTPFTAYAPVAKQIPLKIGLNLTDQFRNAEWKLSRGGGTWVIRPGAYLCPSIETLTRDVFAQVVDVGAGESSLAGLDAILTPRMAYMNRTFGATSFGESITSMRIEWTLADPAGNPVWVETIDGEGKGSTGWTSPKKPLKEALEQVLLKSQQAMLASESIKQFVARTANNAKN